MRALRCSRQQTLFMSFCEASEECQERILRRSSHRFSTTRNHPVWPKVSRPQTEQEVRFRIGEFMTTLLDHQLALATARVRKPGAARLLRGTVSIPRLASKR